MKLNFSFKKAAGLFAITTLYFSQAYASYFVISGEYRALDLNQRTHFFITDKAADLGNAPRYAAISKAKRFKTIYPDDQIVFLIPRKDVSDPNIFKKSGFASSQFINKTLEPAELFNYLYTFKKIASLHTFGHSAIPEGVFLDANGSTDVRWKPERTEALIIKDNFTEDAFATLNGCNAGHVMAPTLSKFWKIPVSGAHVGTHFEAMFPDGSYYYADTKNYQLFASYIDSEFRMRPDNGNYNGHYGKYLQGLPFFKFYCIGISDQKCLSGMAHSLLTSLVERKLTNKPTYVEYAEAVRQWLCPSQSYGQNFDKECLRRLSAINPQNLSPQERVYTPFSGTTSQCSMKSCYVNEKCMNSGSDAWACAKTEVPPAKGTSDTFVKEYIYYLQGYQFL